MANDTFQGWILNLSNGNNLFEGPVKNVGDPSAWQQALQFLRDNPEIKATGLRLQIQGHELLAMPNKMCDGYFQASEIRKKFYRSMGPKGEPDLIFRGIGGIKNGLVYINWLQIDNLQITQEIRDLDSCKIHTTLG